VSESDWPAGEFQQGRFSLSMTTAGLNAQVETRGDDGSGRTLTDTEAASYLVILTKGDETVWGQKAFSEVTEKDCIQPVGSDYMVSAMSCLETEAESANEGWGQPRYSGQSAAFEVKKDETTSVQVNCSMQNAGFCVVFDQTFTDRFPTTYAVTTVDSRDLTFNADNAAVFTGNTLTGGKIAYYNVSSGSTLTVPLLVTGAKDWDHVRLQKSIVMEPGKIYRLIVRVGEDNGKMGVTISYDDEFDLVESEIIVE